MPTELEIREKNFREKIKRDERLVIFVWGPGEPADDTENIYYDKRVEMKKKLDKEFDLSEVYFSEDEIPQETTSYMGSTLRSEALQARLSDVILLLPVSRGSDLELDYFVPHFPRIKEKVVIFIPEEYKKTKGLIGEVYGMLEQHQIIGYTEEELEVCNVAKIKSVNAVLGMIIYNKIKDGH